MLKAIQGVIAISGSLYATSSEALQLLLEELAQSGYTVNNLRECDRRKKDGTSVETMEQNGWSLWFATLDVRRGKCKSCGGYISCGGIQMHGHKCELCGEVTYYDIVDGSTVRFSFIQRDERDQRHADITMKAKRWDTEEGYLYFYPEPKDGLWLKGEAAVAEYLAANNNLWEAVTEGDQSLIRVRYPLEWDYEVAAINPSESYGHYWNHSIVRVLDGVEYPEHGQMPLPDMVSVYESWHWAPLGPDPSLHETIIHAVGMVSRCDYYYQDGRAAFGDVHIKGMTTFVEHFTSLDLEAWTAMIRKAPLSGPGMIRAIAAFCHPDAQVRDEPNIGNALVGVSKLLTGERLVGDEVTAMTAALQDPEQGGMFREVFSGRKAAT
jgi:hypothetical protein